MLSCNGKQGHRRSSLDGQGTGFKDMLEGVALSAAASAAAWIPLQAASACQLDRRLPTQAAAACRALREEMYRTYVTRASSGASDNTPLIERTLALRAEQARLLGYPNYAEVSLARKVCVRPLPPAHLPCLFCLFPHFPQMHV